ncbi:MAG: fumarylacetoacetate hydrolase family protein [Deltaproteobacteria bacterium]|nr:fumarylacetoacetate hydrolase family protein [Deltaproteobacteria bacterium]
MKLIRYDDGRGNTLGAIKDDGVINLGRRWANLRDDMRALIEAWPNVGPAVAGLIAGSAPDDALARVRLLAPVSRPGKILAIGLNYADHVKETGQQPPPHQIWFTKAVTSINPPFDPIELPTASEQLDYEAELVVVIGKRCRHVPKERAVEVIFGYCAGNDVSVRDWQLRTSQWVLGKSFDTHAPIGPWIVTPEEIGDPHALGIRCFVNGEQRQSSNTRHLIFNVFDQIAHLSSAMTLEAGDTIFTGTPGGVGLAMKPPRWLKAGDEIRVEIDRIGAIEATVRPEAL